HDSEPVLHSCALSADRRIPRAPSQTLALRLFLGYSLGRSIMTTCEFSRKRSKTICFPSLVTSKVRMAARFCSLVRGRDFMEARSSSQKSCDASSPCMYTRLLPSGEKRTCSPKRRKLIWGNSTLVPSGRTARRGAKVLTFVPAYTIRLPSGDQTGLSACPATKRTGDPPSNGILKSPGPVASLPPVTIHFASGDQQLVPWTSIPSAMGWSSAPSEERTCSWVFPFRRSTMATRPPSGETAGVSSKAPSAPFQISVTCPSRRRHSPSPVPREDR